MRRSVDGESTCDIVSVHGKMPAMTEKTNRAALDGITLEAMVTQLSERIGWAAMADAVPVRCFSLEPSIKSSLKFLRRTPWARERVEALYLREIALKR